MEIYRYDTPGCPTATCLIIQLGDTNSTYIKYRNPGGVIQDAWVSNDCVTSIDNPTHEEQLEALTLWVDSDLYTWKAAPVGPDVINELLKELIALKEQVVALGEIIAQ